MTKFGPVLSAIDPFRPQLYLCYPSEVEDQEHCGYVEAEGPTHHSWVVSLECFFIMWQVLILKIILFLMFWQLLVSQVQIVIYCNINRIIIFIMKERNSISLSNQKLLILASKISPQAVISLKRSVSVSKAQLDSFRDSLHSIGKKKIMKTEYRQTEDWDK